MNYRYYDIGSKKVRVNFLLSGMGSSDYNVELCMAPNPGTRVKQSHLDRTISAREWGCKDAGLLASEAIKAVEMFQADEHSDYQKWLENLSPEMRTLATP